MLPNDRFVVEDTPITQKGRRYEAVVSIDKMLPWLNFSQPMSSDDDDPSDNESTNKIVQGNSRKLITII